MRVAPFAGTPTDWDAFAGAHPGWTPCHRFGWKRVIEDVFGHETRFLAAHDDAGALRGILPLVRVRSLVFGHFLVSMPFLNDGGPLGSDAAVAALAEHAAALADRTGVGLLELRSRRPLPVPLPVSHRKVTVLLDLAGGDPEALWARLPSKLRSQVRRPMKDGITVRFGADELEPFYAVFAHHMRDLGTPALPRRFFEALRSAFGDDVWFGCAYAGDRAVAAGCALAIPDEVEMTWASALRRFKATSANMLLYWAFIDRAARSGHARFNFGRCTPGSGTHRFKLQWSADERPLWWYQHARRGRHATPAPTDPAFAWGPRLWRRLPLPLATVLGPRIVRSIP
ncbi:MAG TPA: FemAB family XrtA/PEP-CTERM system-associated protein [Longimicrobiales bacterium]|nr:FemAB family XrtA/PEP-CTERM system-associated protein [Longimicrobiales bacterium]